MTDRAAWEGYPESGPNELGHTKGCKCDGCYRLAHASSNSAANWPGYPLPGPNELGHTMGCKCDGCRAIVERLDAIPSRAAEYDDAVPGAPGWSRPESIRTPKPERGAPRTADATPNRAADYPEDLRWRQHVEDEIVCLQEAVADLQRRMAT